MALPQPIDEKNTEEVWKKRLSKEQYEILRLGKREKPNTGKYIHSTESGAYYCAGCNATLFFSFSKIEDGSGYATFKVSSEDTSTKLARTYSIEDGESVRVLCSKCECKIGFVDAEETRNADDIEQGKQTRLVHAHSQAVYLKKTFTIKNYPVTFFLFIAVAVACGVTAWVWTKTFSEENSFRNFDAVYHLWINDTDIPIQKVDLTSVEAEEQLFAFAGDTVLFTLLQGENALKFTSTKQAVDIVWLDRSYQVISFEQNKYSEKETFLEAPKNAVFALVAQPGYLPSQAFVVGFDMYLIDVSKL